MGISFQISRLRLLLCFFCSSLMLAPPAAAAAAAAASCPIDFGYVWSIPWNSSMAEQSINTAYCQTLLSVLGIGLAQRLRDTAHFHLPDTPTAAACLSDFQSALTSSRDLPSTIVSSCFPNPERFNVYHRFCAGIHTLKDWTDLLGTNTSVDRACRPALYGTACSSCVDAGLTVIANLTAIDGNASHNQDCFYFAVNYAAGIANAAGPKDLQTASCIFMLPLLPSTGGSRRRTIAVAVGLSVGGLVVVSALLGLYLLLTLRRRRKRRQHGNIIIAPREGDQLGTSKPKVGPFLYSIDDVRRATEGFSEHNFLGRGGFGVVHKGVLDDGCEVAVKGLTETEELDDETQFRNEVAIISNLRHRNLVSLRGCCVEERRRYLIYDYMPNGNLHDRLFGGSSSGRLTWAQRKEVVLDVAHALAYLHYGVKPAIIHRDVKSTNILLDGSMRARLADFGLAKQGSASVSHLTSKVAGTRGYLAPEYALYGQLTTKSDVYSFGVVVLEVMSGRRALETAEEGSEVRVLAEWARQMAREGRAREVVEEAVASGGAGGAEAAMMERFVLVAVQCVHEMVSLRPTIGDALMMLDGSMTVDVAAIMEKDWLSSPAGATYFPAAATSEPSSTTWSNYLLSAR